MGQDTSRSRSGHGQDMDTFWQEHSHCSSGLGEDMDRTWTHSGRSVHTVGQVLVRSWTRSGRSIHNCRSGHGYERYMVGHVPGCRTFRMWKCLLWKQFMETLRTTERRNRIEFGARSICILVCEGELNMLFRVVFWVILPCKMIVDRRFRGAYCLICYFKDCAS
jgi:hypothetical protein